MVQETIRPIVPRRAGRGSLAARLRALEAEEQSRRRWILEMSVAKQLEEEQAGQQSQLPSSAFPVSQLIEPAIEPESQLGFLQRLLAEAWPTFERVSSRTLGLDSIEPLLKLLPGQQPLEREITEAGGAYPYVQREEEKARRVIQRPIVQGLLSAEQLRTGEEQPGQAALRRLPVFATPEMIEEAFAETELPPGLMGFIEVAADPLVFIPQAKAAGLVRIFGKGAKGAKGAKKLEAETSRLIAPSSIPTQRELLRRPELADDLTNATAEILANQTFKGVGIIRRIVGLVNPSAVASTLEEVGVVAKRRLSQWTITNWALMEDRLVQVFKRNFQFAADETLTNVRIVPGSGANPRPLFSDFASQRSKYLRTPGQDDALNHWDELKDWMIAQRKAEGVPIHELAFGEGDEYFPRVRKHIDDFLSGGGVAKKIGAKSATDKPRVFELAEHGAKWAGKNIYTGPVEAMKVYFHGGMEAIGDKRFANVINALPGVRTTGVPKAIKNALTSAKFEFKAAQAFEAVVKNAQRGNLVVPGPTLAKIERMFPGSGLKQRLQAAKGLTGKALRDELQDIREEAHSLASGARRYMNDVARDHKRALSFARRKHAGEAFIQHPAFAGKIYPQAVADGVQKALGGDVNAVLKKAGDISGASVALGTTFDAGWPFIQGLSLLANNPVRWAKLVAKQIELFVRTDTWAKIMSKPGDRAAAQEASRYGVIFQMTSEMTEEAARGGLLTRMNVSGVPIGKAFGKAAEPFQRAFTVSGNIDRLETWKALVATAAKKGEKGLEELADFVNKKSGTLSQLHLGLSPAQQAGERLLGYAPRFLKATVGLTTDALRGGLKGELARENLARLAYAGTAFYLGIGLMLGQKPNLDPRPASLGGSGGKFFTYRIGGANVGIGGGIMTIARLLAHSYAALDQDPGAFVRIDGGKDNPFLRFMRSKSSPVASAAWDTITGRTFIGESTRGLPDVALKVLGPRLAPFWLGNQFDNPRPGFGGAGEILGLRTYSVQPWEMRNDLRNQFAEKDIGKSWEELTVVEQIQIEREHPELAEATAKAREISLERADDLGLLIHDRQVEVEDARQTLIDSLDTYQEEYEDFGLEGFGRRERIRDKIDIALADYRKAWQRIESHSKYALVNEKFAELTNEKKRTYGDVAFDDYIATVLSDPELVSRFNEYDFDLRERLDRDFQQKWGKEVWDYVQNRRKESRADRPPIVQELQDGRETPLWSAYWSVARIVTEQMGTPELLAQYQNYVRADSFQKEEMALAFPQLKQMAPVVTKIRQRMRERNKGLDAFLFRFGYTPTVRHRDNLERGERMVLDFG